MNLKQNLKILLYFVAIIAMFGALGLALYFGFVAMIFSQWIRAAALLLLFLLAVWISKSFASWKSGGMLVVCMCSFFSCILDLHGNPILNAPIRWFYRSIGQFTIATLTTVSGGETSIHYAFQIITQNGDVVKTIPMFLMFVFRFFEYILLYAVLLSILYPILRALRKYPNA